MSVLDHYLSAKITLTSEVILGMGDLDVRYKGLLEAQLLRLK